MKYYFVLIFFWLCPFHGQGQELIWEKKIPLSNYESFSCITKSSGGEYLALGASDRWKVVMPMNVYSGAIIMKFDENGDTIWTKFTGYYGGFNKVIRGEDGLYYALMAYVNPGSVIANWGIYVFNENGLSLSMIPINTSSSVTLLDMEYRHGYLWISGQKTPSLFYPTISGAFDFLLMKLRTDGTEVFSFVYNANEAASRGRMMEFMPNGNILFSGSAGTKIGAFEIDTAGNQIQYRNYFTNPLNGGWQGAAVYEAPNQKRSVSGIRSTTPTSYYLAQHDTSGSQIWGGISLGGTTNPMVFTDGSIVHINNSRTPLFSKIRKLSLDSIPLWSLDLMGPGLIEGRKAISDTWFDSDSSGVCAGTMVPNSGGGQNLYIAKFAKLGIPFDPTSGKVLEKLKTDAQPIPFPNPGTNLIKFTILAGPGKVSFTDMKGRKVFDGEYLPEKGVSTKGFPAGIYNYRLERNGKVWGGKWVKAP